MVYLLKKSLKGFGILNKLTTKFTGMPLKFILIGVLNTFFGYIVFALLSLVNLIYPVALALSMVIGIFFNFYTTGKFVFRSINFFRFHFFIFVYLFVYLLNIIFMTLLLNLGIKDLIAYAIIIFPSAILTFFMLKKYVYISKL